MSALPVAAIGVGSLDPVQSLLGPAQSGPMTAAVAEGSEGFGKIVTDGLQAVNQDLMTAQVSMQSLAAGNASSLHQVMIDVEQSRISFELMMQVRNRLLDSLQDVLKMQV